jgi:hypothetical protein
VHSILVLTILQENSITRGPTDGQKEGAPLEFAPEQWCVED